MVTTPEAIETPNFVLDWTIQDGLRASGRLDELAAYRGERDPEPEPSTDVDIDPEPTPVRVPRDHGVLADVIAAATGVYIDLDADDEDIEPFAVYDAPAEPVRPPTPPVERVEPASDTTDHSRPYKVAQATFMAAKGLTRKHRKLPPSRTTEGRRRRHIEQKAERLGISVAEAERMTSKRPGATRHGRERLVRL